MTTKPPGKIITFYSYKGGTGRSMALANVAWILASQGKRVLTLDWDLEAPGLHRYFHPFLVDKELTSSDGLIDFVIKFAAAAATPEPAVPTAADGRQAKGAVVYLAETTSDLAARRDAVKDVLTQSGYTVVPDAPLPSDPREFEMLVRDYLKRATLSVHLVGQGLAEGESYPFVHRQNMLASERNDEREFSRLIWQPLEGSSPQLSQSELLLDSPLSLEAHNNVTLLQGPLDELFNVIRERVEREQGDKDWYKPYANILRYASSLDWNFKSDDNNNAVGCLDLIPAGRQGSSYSTRVNSFNWQHFYDRLGGGVLLEMAKERMRAEYDYILIDSRTGVSDTSGICTVQMPDILVVCFTLNNQSIEGAGAVADSVYAQRGGAQGQTEFRIFPVPTRVEKFEKERLELAREVAHERFNPLLLGHIENENERDRYWGSVEIFYEPFYAYEEMLASFGDKPHQTNSLLASMERLTGYLTNNEVTKLEPVSESDRQVVLGKYARQTKRREPAPLPASPAQKYWFYLSYSANDDMEMIEKFFANLSTEVRMRLGLDASAGIGFFDRRAITAGDDWGKKLLQAIENSRVFVSLLSPAYLNSEWCLKEFKYFWEREKANGQLTAERLRSGILPIAWLPLKRDMLPEPTNRMLTYSPEGGLRRLMRSSGRSGEYEDFLDRLTDDLVEAAQAKLSPASVPPFNDVRSESERTATSSDASSAPDSAQLAGGPRHVKFMFVVASPEEMSPIRSNVGEYTEYGSYWQPFFPPHDEPIVVTATRVAIVEGFGYEMLPVDDDLLTRVRLAEDSNSPVILIVDPWTTTLPRYRQTLQMFDRYAFINCAVLIVWNDRHEETKASEEMLRQSVTATFPFHLGTMRDELWNQVRSREELEQTLIRSLIEIRSRIMRRGQIMKRIDAGEALPWPRLSVTNDAT